MILLLPISLLAVGSVFLDWMDGFDFVKVVVLWVVFLGGWLGVLWLLATTGVLHAIVKTVGGLFSSIAGLVAVRL